MRDRQARRHRPSTATTSSSLACGALALAAVLLSLLAAPAAVRATEEPELAVVTMSPEQHALNDAGVQALIDGKHQRAIRKLQQALALGPVDLVLVNLGRAYALAGQCTEAITAFEQVASAPGIADIPRAEIEATLARYRADLRRQCPGRVLVVCEPRDLRLRIDNEPDRTCPSEALELSAGPHIFIAHGATGEPLGQQVVEVVALDTQVVRVGRHAFSDDTDWSALHTAGWATAGSGAALLVGALLVELLVLQPDAAALRAAGTRGDRDRYHALQDSISTLQGVNIGLVAVGTAALLTGGGLLIAAWASDETDDTGVPSFDASLRLAPSGAALRIAW